MARTKQERVRILKLMRQGLPQVERKEDWHEKVVPWVAVVRPFIAEEFPDYLAEFDRVTKEPVWAGAN